MITPVPKVRLQDLVAAIQEEVQLGLEQVSEGALRVSSIVIRAGQLAPETLKPWEEAPSQTTAVSVGSTVLPGWEVEITTGRTGKASLATRSSSPFLGELPVALVLSGLPVVSIYGVDGSWPAVLEGAGIRTVAALATTNDQEAARLAQVSAIPSIHVLRARARLAYQSLPPLPACPGDALTLGDLAKLPPDALRSQLGADQINEDLALRLGRVLTVLLAVLKSDALTQTSYRTLRLSQDVGG
ncbi:MAG TPA: hypothetical protein VEU96_16635 [Bryobacteraceae bacterium]|nr:hypothetical protein [Bryobacteraceae bacterium]